VEKLLARYFYGALKFHTSYLVRKYHKINPVEMVRKAQSYVLNFIAVKEKLRQSLNLIFKDKTQILVEF